MFLSIANWYCDDSSPSPSPCYPNPCSSSPRCPLSLPLLPYPQRNLARVCTFFAKGACTRGAECPYRHEMPTTGELANQNMKDRYYGVNDPVANKMMRRVDEMNKLVPPPDT